MSAIYPIQQGLQDVVRNIEFPNQTQMAATGIKKVRTGSDKPQLQLNRDQNINIGDLEKRTDQLNQMMEIFNYNIRFSLDQESKRVIVKIVDPGTEEVVRQIPPEEMLHIMKKIDQMLGLILDEKV